MTSKDRHCDDTVSDMTFDGSTSESESTVSDEPTLCQPSPPESDGDEIEESVENYVASTGESFVDRMKHRLPVHDRGPFKLC